MYTIKYIIHRKLWKKYKKSSKTDFDTWLKNVIFDILYFVSRYGACSSGVERQIVDLVVVGSNPIRHPNPIRYCFWGNAPVAHLDRAPDFESGGSRFESCRTQKHIGPLAQLVEQQTLNLWVEGSNPSWLKRLSQTRKSFFLS